MAARKSNIEFMRIILFFMVVAIHTSAPYLSHSTVTGVMNWQFSNFVDGISRIAVGGFVLITGYFMVHNQALNKSRQIVKLALPILFYLIPYSYFYFRDYLTLFEALFHLLKDLLRNEGYFYHMWFFQTIIFIYLFSWFFNKVIHNISEQQFRWLIILLLSISSFMPTLCYAIGMEIFNLTLLNSRFLLFVTLYFIGAYIKLYHETSSCQKKTSVKKLLTLFIILELAIVFLSFFYNYKYSPYVYAQKLLNYNLVYPFPGFIGAFFDYNNLLVITAAVVFFLLILKLNFQSRFVNSISRCTYGSYIIHVFWIQLISSNVLFLNPFAKFDSPRYPLAIVEFIVIVGSLSIITEMVRAWTVKVVGGLLPNRKKSAKEQASERQN